MAKMNPGMGPAAGFGQPAEPGKKSPGEQMRLPGYIAPGETSAAQPLQMSGAPAALTMNRNRYGAAMPGAPGGMMGRR